MKSKRFVVPAGYSGPWVQGHRLHQGECNAAPHPQSAIHSVYVCSLCINALRDVDLCFERRLLLRRRCDACSVRFYDGEGYAAFMAVPLHGASSIYGEIQTILPLCSDCLLALDESSHTAERGGVSSLLSADSHQQEIDDVTG